jgi:restriction system protein
VHPSCQTLDLTSTIVRKSQKKLFEQLAPKKQTVLREPLRNFMPALPSRYPLGTLGYVADQLGRTPEALAAQFNEAGVPGLTPDHKISEDNKDTLLGYLRAQNPLATIVLYESNQPVEGQLLVVQDISSELIARLAKEPTLIYQLEPRKFEELVAKLLEAQGCRVTLTKRTRDGGYDILGQYSSGPAELLFLAECKRYAPDNKVGVEVIRGLYGVTEARNANFGLVITSSSFTRDAKEEKLRIGPRIQLKEYEDVRSWLSSARKSEV